MRLHKPAILAMALLAGAAQAAPGDGQGPYLLFGLGLARIDLGDRQASDQAAVDQFEASVAGGTGETSASDSSSTFGVAVGYRLGRHLALEAGYRNFGEMHAGYTLHDGPTVTGQDVRYQAAGPGVSVLALLPLSPAWRVYGRVDAVALRTSVEETYVAGGGSGVFPSDHAGMRVGYGLGAEADVAGGLALRLEARRLNAEFDTLAGIERHDLDSVGIAVVKTF